MATSKFRPIEVPQQVSPEIRDYLDRMLTEMAVLLDGAADYIDDATIAHTDADEAITGAWTFADPLTISSAGDASLFIKADINNVDETANPFIRMEQDGNAVQGIIGLTGAADVDAEGNTFTGASANALALHALWTGGTLAMGVGGSVAMRFASDNQATFYENVTIDPDTTGPFLMLGDGTGASGDALLYFNIDRAWQFEQRSTGAGTALMLRSITNGKSFFVGDENSANIAGFVADGAGGSSRFEVQRGLDFRIADADYSHYMQMNHDGADFNMDLNSAGEMALNSNVALRVENTNDVSLTSTNHGFQIGDSASLNIRMDNNEIICCSNGVANTLQLQATGGGVYVNESTAGLGLYVRRSGAVRAYDAANSNFGEWDVQDLSGNSDAARMNLNGNATISAQYVSSIADDATATFNAPSSNPRGIAFIVSSYDTTAMCVFFYSGSQVLSIAAGSNTSIGTSGTNPNVDTDMNVWVDGGGNISIKNRLGSSRTFAVYRMTDV